MPKNSSQNSLKAARYSSTATDSEKESFAVMIQGNVEELYVNSYRCKHKDTKNKQKKKTLITASILELKYHQSSSV